MSKPAEAPATDRFDTSSHQEFVEYYEKASLSETTRQRFEGIRRNAIRLATGSDQSARPLDMLDIGCGPGMQCVLWAAAGHRVTGIDINAPLIEVGRKRAAEAGLVIRFEVGSATALPCASASMDVCLMPELLEHIADWEPCIDEAVRVLRPGGVLFLSTSNWLCPVQQEFNLPLYSWYPGFLKRRYEKLAVTTRPELANYARYPAVHWFSYYQLERYLARHGMRCFDRFGMLESAGRSAVERSIIALLRGSSLLRFLGQICTSGTTVYAIKQKSA